MEAHIRTYFAEWRKFAGLSQRQLGRLCGITKTHVGRIENHTRGWNDTFLLNFQKAVGCRNVWDPLAVPPNGVGRAAEPVTDEALEKRIFKRADELRQQLRAAQEKETAKRKALRAARKTRKT